MVRCISGMIWCSHFSILSYKPTEVRPQVDEVGLEIMVGTILLSDLVSKQEQRSSWEEGRRGAGSPPYSCFIPHPTSPYMPERSWQVPIPEVFEHAILYLVFGKFFTCWWYLKEGVIIKKFYSSSLLFLSA